MRQPFYRIFLFLIILIASNWIIARLYERFVVSKAISVEGKKPYWIMNKENEKYGFAALGSSRTHTMLDINKMERKLNTKGINIALNGRGLAENLLIFNRFIKKNQVDHLLLQIDHGVLDDPEKGFSHPFHAYFYMHLLGKDPLVDSIIKAKKPDYKYWLWKYIPGIKYYEFKNNYNLYGYPKEFNENGTNIKDGNFKVREKDYKKTVKYKLDRESFHFLKKIVELSRQKGITVVLYTAPFYKKYYKRIRLSWNKIKKAIKPVILKDHVHYLDFSQCSISEQAKFFRNSTHLNKSGVEAFSGKFASALSPILLNRISKKEPARSPSTHSQ